ncbi:MAG: SAM-dependent chlorinase/fluorinase [Dehalococcoidia bacterium]|nr:SAM-dependent chlorinase/fluorinase [Dehalococcoidia bacterium]
MSPVITLTTDFGSDDAYVGVLKGVILSTNPKANIVDISHSIEPQNVAQAAFVLSIACRYFPKHSIHMAICDPGVGSERLGIILKTPSALFVAPDNGTLSYVVKELSFYEGASTQYSHDLEEVKLKKGLEAVAITDPRFWRHPVSPTFHARDIFAPVAAGLSLGISPYEFGEKITSLQLLPLPKPSLDSQGNLTGQVLYVDHFGNLITDVRSRDLADGDVIIEVAGQHIQGITRYYEQEQRLMAILGSSGYLEVSLRNGSAADFLGAIVGDEVRVVPA